MRMAPAARFAVAVALLCSFGCSSSNKGKIEGTSWTSLPGTVKGRAIPAGVAHLEFRSDGKLTYQLGNRGTFTGTYTLGWNDHVTLKFDQELDGRKSHVERISISGERLTLTDWDGAEVSFEKDVQSKK